MPSPKLRFFGVAAYELINSRGQRILVDPFLDDCPGNPMERQGHPHPVGSPKPPSR